MPPESADVRQERDAFGEIDVRADRYWGAQTERGPPHLPDRARDLPRPA